MVYIIHIKRCLLRVGGPNSAARMRRHRDETPTGRAQREIKVGERAIPHFSVDYRCLHFRFGVPSFSLSTGKILFVQGSTIKNGLVFIQ